MKRSIALTVGAAVTMLMLAACTPGGGTPPGSSSPEPAPTVTVTATPAPAPEPAAAPDYGFTFFKEATVGSTWDEMSTQLHYQVAGIDEPWNGQVCPHYGLVWGTGVITTVAFMDEGRSAFFYTNFGGATASSSFPRNAEGVGVGSTKAEILAAYPSAVVDSHTDLGAGDMTRLTVDDPDSDSKYVFAINGNAGADVVDLLQWGPLAGNQWSHLCSGF